MIRTLLVLAAILAGLIVPAAAQTVVTPCITSVNAGAGGINCQNVTAANPLPVTMLSGGYPSGSTAITGNATGTTGSVVGSLAGVSAKTTYICGFNVSATGGTAAVGPIVVANTVTGSLTFELNSSVAGSNLVLNFNPCIPANAVNTAITTTTTADASASAVAVNSWGFQQ